MTGKKKPDGVDSVDWVSARIAYEAIVELQDSMTAGASIVEQASAGLIRTRAGALQIGKAQEFDVDLGREFWDDRPIGHGEYGVSGSTLKKNWQSGTFANWVGHEYRQALRVKFARVDIEELAGQHIFTELSADNTSNRGSQQSAPPLPRAKLEDWWRVTNGATQTTLMSENDLLKQVRAAFPSHQISRDRLRKLRGPQKRGKKPFRGELPAN
jgi:hypothetical protein